jgi:preprotein translocase subunit SecB
MELNLVGFDVLELNFENKVQGSQKLEMETNVQYSVNIAANRPQCRGEAWLTVQDKSPNHLVTLKLHAVGVFSFAPVEITDEVKRQLHIGTFEALYPYLSAQVACFTSLVGMPRFIIPKLNIAQDDVMIINMGK